MIIPVRCYSCGKVIGNLYEKYKALLDEDYTESEALDELNLARYCCRRMILTHIDLVDNLVPYSVPVVGNMQQLTPPQGQNSGSNLHSSNTTVVSQTTASTLRR